MVKWWRGSVLVDESYFTTPKGVIRNVIQLPKLTRDDLMMVLTCQASNTNLTVPASQTIAIDLNRKYYYYCYSLTAFVIKTYLMCFVIIDL